MCNGVKSQKQRTKQETEYGREKKYVEFAEMHSEQRIMRLNSIQINSAKLLQTSENFTVKLATNTFICDQICYRLSTECVMRL